jgi:hypothetical protein
MANVAGYRLQSSGFRNEDRGPRTKEQGKRTKGKKRTLPQDLYPFAFDLL